MLRDIDIVIPTRHKLGDFFRRQRRAPKALGGSKGAQQIAEISAGQPDDEEDGCGSEETQALYRRVLHILQAEFEEQTWRAFWSVVVDGRKPSDVAADSGVSVNAVYLAKSRVLRRVREELGDVID